MNCTVYRVANGTLVLVPDCMQAFMSVELELGALVRCGSIDTAQLDPTLARQIEGEIDARFYALCPPDVALRLGYLPEAMIDLPLHFRWEEGDWWTQGDAVKVVCCRDETPVIVASAVAGPHGGWKASVNDHKPPWFRGARVAKSRHSAMQYIALWVSAHADVLLREAASLSSGAGERVAERR